MARRKTKSRFKVEFRPDRKELAWLKALYLTRLQRLQILKWTLYALVCIFMLVIQDVIMSRVSIFGSTTDLAVSAILLITLLEGSERGSIFVLIASVLYFFSGSAPGAFVIASLSFLGILATLFRQMFLHRSFGSLFLCAGSALIFHEMISFVAGLLMGYTMPSRAGIFALMGILSWLVMLPLYPLVSAIGKIGGQSWKE